MTIRKLGDKPVLFEKIELDSFSFKCDNCGVLIATCFDWGFNEDYAVAKQRVKEMVMYCGKCKYDNIEVYV